MKANYGAAKLTTPSTRLCTKSADAAPSSTTKEFRIYKRTPTAQLAMNFACTQYKLLSRPGETF